MTKSPPTKPKYKRKFLIPGDTIQTCHNACPFRWDKRVCYYYVDAIDYYGRKFKDLKRDQNRCPIKAKLDKPNDYMVSEKLDGTWSCACKGWIFKYRKLGQDCSHIIEAKAHKEKYEVPVDYTGTSVDILKKVFS